jgi:hypothetical protein
VHAPLRCAWACGARKDSLLGRCAVGTGAVHQHREDRDWGELPWARLVRDRFPGSFDSPLVPHSPSQAQGQGPAGSLKMTKGSRSTFRGPKGSLLHQEQAEPNLDTRRPRRVSSLFFAVPRRRETVTCKGDAAMQVLHSRFAALIQDDFVAPRNSTRQAKTGLPPRQAKTTPVRGLGSSGGPGFARRAFLSATGRHEQRFCEKRTQRIAPGPAFSS